MRRSFDAGALTRLRAVPLAAALEALDLYVKRDRDFTPVKDATTQRWLVSVGGGVFELLVTGAKWFDPRAGRGGGGAIDLCMHLMRIDFVQAVKRLTRAGL